MKELPAASAEHSAVKLSAVGRPPAIKCTTRGVLGGGERASASHTVAAEAHNSVRGLAPKTQLRQPSGAPSATQTCKPGCTCQADGTYMQARAQNVPRSCVACAPVAAATSKSCKEPSSLTTAASPWTCGLHSTCAARIREAAYPMLPIATGTGCFVEEACPDRMADSASWFADTLRHRRRQLGAPNGVPYMHARHEIGAIRSPRRQQPHRTSVTCKTESSAVTLNSLAWQTCSHLAPVQAAEAGARRAAAPPATARQRRLLLAETPAPPRRLSSSGQQGGTPAPPARCWESGAAAAPRACCHRARRCEHVWRVSDTAVRRARQ